MKKCELMQLTNLPKSIQETTIGDLLQDERSTVVKDKNKLKIRSVRGDSILSIEVKGYSDGKILTGGEFERPERKKDLAQTIRQLYSEGMTQKDIAFMLDVSQSYVSLMLKK